MGEPMLKNEIKLTPGNRKQKGRRSAPMAEARQTGKTNPILFRFKDSRIGEEMDVLNSANGWWAEDIYGPVKVQKLVDAYCFYMTDEEACNYAGISRTQLEYFQKLHPDFYGIKHACKSQPGMHAKKKIVETAAKDVQWAAWWLVRTQKDEFSTRVEATGANGRDLFDGMTAKLNDLTKAIENGGEIKEEEYPNIFNTDNDDAGPDGDRDAAEVAEPTA